MDPKRLSELIRRPNQWYNLAYCQEAVWNAIMDNPHLMACIENDDWTDVDKRVFRRSAIKYQTAIEKYMARIDRKINLWWVDHHNKFKTRLEHEISEAIICLKEDNPNVSMALDRLNRMRNMTRGQS